MNAIAALLRAIYTSGNAELARSLVSNPSPMLMSIVEYLTISAAVLLVVLPCLLAVVAESKKWIIYMCMGVCLVHIVVFVVLGCLGAFMQELS